VCFSSHLLHSLWINVTNYLHLCENRVRSIIDLTRFSQYTPDNYYPACIEQPYSSSRSLEFHKIYCNNTINKYECWLSDDWELHLLHWQTYVVIYYKQRGETPIITAAIRCPQPLFGKAPSGERLRDKGRHGIICR